MKPTLIPALILALAAAPVGAVVQPDKPKEEQPEKPSKPDKPGKPEPKSKPDRAGKSRTESRPEPREAECPYTRLKVNGYRCVATVRPKARPVSDQDYFVPTGEKR